jgi:predicted dehydrogenase
MPVRVGVFGAGGWGANWAERAMMDPEMDVVAFVDTRPQVLDALAERGVARDTLFDSAQEALETAPLDAVTVSIPNPAREPVLRAALERGWHVLADKPLVHSADTLRELLALGRGRSTVFSVAQNYRLFESVLALRKALKSGHIGRVGAAHVQFLRPLPAGPDYFVHRLPGVLPLGAEMSIHHFDMMRYLLGSDPVRISAAAWRENYAPGEGWTSLAAVLEFPEDVRVVYDASWTSPRTITDWPGHWEVVGETGHASFGREGQCLELFDRHGKPVRQTGTVPALHTLDGVWAAWKRAIASGRPDDVFCPLEDNARSLAISFAVGEAAESGMTVEYDDFLKERVLPL